MDSSLPAKDALASAPSAPVEPTSGSSAWTAGPWVWDRNKPGEMRGLFGTGGDTVLYADADVSSYGLSVDPFIEASEANARLIAAAPELYAALKFALEMLQTDERDLEPMEYSACLNDAERQATAALRKATTV